MASPDEIIVARPTRAMMLIEKLLRDALTTEAELATQLVVDQGTLRAYRAGTQPIPPDRQLCLALVATQLPPKYARLGFQLRSQVRAAVAFEQGVTRAHDHPPLSFRRS